jgi:hypothetical protein
LVGEKINDYAGANGYGLMHTVRRDLLPPDVPEQYFHKKKTTQNLNQRARVARFNHPITAVKNVMLPAAEPGLTPTSYYCVHVSFQSTGPTNIGTVNLFNENSLFVRTKECSRGKCKRKWAIEMNTVHQFYLDSYKTIDDIDQRIKNLPDPLQKLEILACSQKSLTAGFGLGDSV